jgi:hypothetical protein
LITSYKSEKEEPKQKTITFIITETKRKQKGKSYADEKKTTALQASSPSPKQVSRSLPFTVVLNCSVARTVRGISLAGPQVWASGWAGGA